MSISTANAYSLASSKSYAGQKDRFTIEISQERPVEIPLGFQPLGISSSGSLVAIAAYFEPAILLAEATVSQGVLNLDQIRWIRGTMWKGSSVRMFPDIFQPGGANRLQNVLIYSPKLLGLTRGPERSIFVIELLDDWKWHHTGKTLLPESGYPLLHSTVMEGDHLFTTESDGSLENWAFCTYQADSPQDLRFISCEKITPWRYLGAHRHDGVLCSIGDVRAESNEGIFMGERLVLAVAGTGVALLNGGESGALVTRHGQSWPGPFNGVPGALIYVPPGFVV